MVEQQFRIAEIEVAKSPTDEKIVGVFRYENSSHQRKGTTLLILAEIASTLYAYERLLDVINATAEQAKHLVAGVEQDPVARFEKLVQRLNDSIARFLEGEPTPVAWNRINIYVMELSPDHICLTGTGRLMNVFFQKQADGTYKTFDLFGSLEQPTDIDPKKPLASLICGDMKPGDILIAGTTNLERLRSELQFKERLTTMPLVSATLEIKQDLERRGIPDDFVAVAVASYALEMPAPAPKPDVPEIDKSTDSINKLLDTVKETTQNLSPTIAPPKSVQSAPKAGKEWVAAAGNALKNLQQRVMKSRGIKDVAAMTSLRAMNAGHGSVFTKKHKNIATVIGIVLIVGIIGMLLWKKHQSDAAFAAAWQTTFDQATDNRNRAESDLVYANDARAQKEIATADQLLTSLDTSKADWKQKVDGLRNEIAQLKERMRKASTVTPTTLAELTNAADGSLTAPVLVKDVAYAVDNDTKNILKVDVTNKTIKRIPLPAGTSRVVAGSHGNKSVVFATETGKYFAIDVISDTLTTLISHPHTSTTTDLVLYTGKAYSLDGTSGQVFKASASGDGFGTEASYIKASNVDLTGAVSLAIDSNVYVLKSDGTVVRFLSGGQEGFALTTIEPQLRTASAIWTDVDSAQIDITDPVSKRVIMFNKDGTLKAQLTSTSFQSPRDLDVDEVAKRMVVTDGNRLLLVPLP